MGDRSSASQSRVRDFAERQVNSLREELAKNPEDPALKDEHMVASRLLTSIEEGTNYHAVVDPDGRVIGAVTFSERRLQGKLVIEELFVGPEARGTGAGAALLREAINLAHQKGYYVELQPTPEAIPFYLRQGGELVEEEYGPPMIRFPAPGPGSKSLDDIEGSESKDALDPNGEGSDSIQELMLKHGMTREQAEKAEQARQIAQVFQAVDVSLTLLGDNVPPAVRDVIRNSMRLVNVLHDPSVDGGVSLALSVLNAFDVPGAVGDAAKVAQYAWRAKQLIQNPSVTGGVQFGLDLGMRIFDVDPKARALAQMAMSVGRLIGGDLTALASLPGAVMGINQAFTDPRIDLGELSVGDGLTARVDFKQTGQGPEYQYILAGGQANLPEMVGASFRLLRNDDGSFRISGFGNRAPFSPGMEKLGGMMPPNWVEDGYITKKGPSGRPLFHVTEEVGERWLAMQGGKTRFDVDQSFPDFHIVRGLFEEAELDTIYRRSAKQGLLSTVDAGLGAFDYIQFPHGFRQVQGWDDKIVAHFAPPGAEQRFTFRDLDSAALFQAYGLDILSRVNVDPALIALFGPPRDIQGMIDHVLAHPGRPEDPFDAFAYLAANPDLQAHFDERDLMGVSLHYLTAGHSEGRARHADPLATMQELQRFLAFSVFDENVYRTLYPDVAAAIDAGGVSSALDHFRHHGFGEGRLPSFNEQSYLAANPDVAAAVLAGQGSAIDHWVQFGQHEGRQLAPAGFDEQAYLAANPDVAEALTAGTIDSAMGHYARHGQFEGRQLAPAHVDAEFDEAAYLAANQDVAAAIAAGTMDSAYGHFQRHGRDEGRGAFDAETYLAHNQDVAAAVERGEMTAVDHWNHFGQHEGRAMQIAPVAEHVEHQHVEPASGFSAQSYLDNNPDVLAAAAAEGRDPHEFAATHYETFGAAEGRVI